MGCAQETFDRILGYIHRELVDPNYLETFCNAANSETRWQLDNRLDEMGCTPKCASHLVFGIQSMDTTRCASCEVVDDIAEVKAEFI